MFQYEWRETERTVARRHLQQCVMCTKNRYFHITSTGRLFSHFFPLRTATIPRTYFIMTDYNNHGIILNLSHFSFYIWIVSFSFSLSSGFWLGSPSDSSCTNCLDTWPSPILSYKSAQGSGFHDYLGSATIFAELDSSKVHIWVMVSIPSQYCTHQ